MVVFYVYFLPVLTSCFGQVNSRCENLSWTKNNTLGSCQMTSDDFRMRTQMVDELAGLEDKKKSFYNFPITIKFSLYNFPIIINPTTVTNNNISTTIFQNNRSYDI